MAISRNPFFSEVDRQVREELDARKNDIGKFDRAESLRWQYGKTAYAILTNINTGETISALKGGFGSMYEQKTDSYRPKPFLNSVRVTNEGRYGSVRKSTVEFSVFNLEQLNHAEQHFMIPGTELSLEFGWSLGILRTQGINREQLKGRVYNFNFDLRDDGGFDCSISLVAEGFFAKGLETKTPVDKDTANIKNIKTKNSETINLDAPTVKDKIIYDKYSLEQANTKSRVFMDSPSALLNSKPGRMVNVIVDTKADPSENSENPVPDDTRVVLSNEWFVSLYYVVNVLVNDLILNIGSTKTGSPSKKFRGARYLTNPKVSCSWNHKDVFSADPSKIIFPDTLNMANYGDGKNGEYIKKSLTVAGYGPHQDGLFILDDTFVDLGETLINVNEVIRILEDAEKEEGIDIHDNPLNRFLQKIFDLIRDVSGEVYQLTLILIDDEKDSDGAIEIVDANMTMPGSRGENSEPRPYIFTPFTPQSIVRKISMSSELPDKMATALYIGGSKQLSATDGKVASIITGEPYETQPTDTENSISEKDLQDIIKDASKVVNPGQYLRQLANYARASNIEVSSDLSSWKDIDTQVTIRDFTPRSADQIRELIRDLTPYILKTSRYRNLLGSKGSVPSVVEAAKKVMLKFKDSAEGLDRWNNRLLYPIKLSVTLDGISGFRFGNVVTSSWLPAKYKAASQLVFVITKIEHDVSNGEWVTNIQTQCRLSLTDTGVKLDK